MIKRPPSKQPLPKGAKLVFKGIVFDVYQWEQELFDGSKTTFEKLKRPDTVVVIPVTAGVRILLTKQEQPGRKPYVGVASGRIEEGETAENAAMRELLEETGYQAKSLSLWFSFQPASKIDYAVFIFIAKDCQKVSLPRPEAGEKITIETVTLAQFLKLVYRGFVNEEIRSRLIDETVKLLPDSQKTSRLQNFFLK